MMTAFDTLTLELERLILLKQSIELAGVSEEESESFLALTNKISDHEHAIQVIVRESQRERRVLESGLTRLAH